ncbi:hypothetical protein BCR41DRAFT_355701 [Lobosporangium transversale]|uniref:Myb-like domain-containing protein n=1 Tax=Lobosporangium transversale TaxID=64571 RepID=A0A1Y2GK83_9FUNG|nr:hypothetical protein BCR41DRAFT_355701 [Lobosporangium transversale]ORZ13419.1 hypothetical protein BCR41DRAFT_355701 [Lobosporangium transversale]|eukprot:XP_021880500.1 hypothetical protein BCR41DRAFT_355701 [Lobosporangium transversale]
MANSSNSSRANSPSATSEKTRCTIFRKEYEYNRAKNVFSKPIIKPALSDTRPVNVLKLLIQQRELEKEAALKAEIVSSKDASDNEDAEDNKENIDNIQKVRKERVFEQDVTEKEMDIIQQRIAFQQRQFAAFEEREKQRRYKKFKQHYGYLVEAEIDEAYEDCNNDEDDAFVQFSTRGYLEKIRRTIAIRNHRPATITVMDDQQRARYEEHLKKRREAPRMRTTTAQKKQYRMGGRLGLDEALKQVQENTVDASKAFEGWSDARIKAYAAIDKKPNTYYYRFNAPGEVQRKGAWTKEEQKRFHERLAEIGANGQWGIFSMTIPGRVGYQCSNYYRLLVETNQIQDPNYVLDEKGKAHYLFDKKGANGETTKEFRTHNKHNIGGSEEKPTVLKPPKEPKASKAPKESKPPKEPKAPKAPKVPREPKTSAAASRNKRKRRSLYNDDDSSDISEFDCDDSGSYMAKWSTTKRTRTRAANAANGSPSGAGGSDGGQEEEIEGEEDEDALNPLPKFIDPITLEVVEKPAISKYGHVMGYDSWIRCLLQDGAAKNICPLTKKPLTKRDLTILTFENIEEYRDKIVNM